ncbi:(d)CMP kinase [Legionella sp. W05-934-2]|jgi:cytidylate kinase|uniref:(d)CMP kinase n=1 Tax=Legionella sp. W05-934-2 TaxID=1198649 RepID=UPI003462627A
MGEAKQVPVITLDGPSGTGKGTISLLLAQKLGWHYLDSGAIYRVFAYGTLQNHIDSTDLSQLVSLAKKLPLRFVINEAGEQQVFYEQTDVTSAIRTPTCSQKASELAAIPEVRSALLQRQRDFATPPGLVTDGRDMGTVVFPDAFLKIYMDASADERAKRRYLQLQSSEKNASLAQVIKEIKERDKRDRERSVAPLKPAENSVIIDTTSLTIVQVLSIVLQLVEKQLDNR